MHSIARLPWIATLTVLAACGGGESPGNATDLAEGPSAATNPGSGDGDGDGDPSATADGPTSEGETGPDLPDLPGACAAATTQCSDDGFGTSACGWNPEVGGTDWGWRVPCGSDEMCVDGECVASSCRAPELLFVVDRSDSQLDGDKWSWVSASLGQFGADVGLVATQGVRMFPDQPCTPAEVQPILLRPEGFAELLVAPTTGASTPIRLALADVQPAFGDPDQSQAVILVTDGDETCEPDASPELEASNLFRLGIRTFAIGVSTQANLTLLDEIAAAGGTGTARLAADGAALRGALDAIMAELQACTACNPGELRCSDGVMLVCNASGSDFEMGETCSTHACLDDGTCLPAPQNCGWDPANAYYNCGFQGVAPGDGAPIACPEGLIEDDACSETGLTDIGCCDANGDNWFCSDGTVARLEC